MGGLEAERLATLEGGATFRVVTPARRINPHKRRAYRLARGRVAWRRARLAVLECDGHKCRDIDLEPFLHDSLHSSPSPWFATDRGSRPLDIAASTHTDGSRPRIVQSGPRALRPSPQRRQFTGRCRVGPEQGQQVDSCGRFWRRPRRLRQPLRSRRSIFSIGPPVGIRLARLPLWQGCGGRRGRISQNGRVFLPEWRGCGWRRAAPPI